MGEPEDGARAVAQGIASVLGPAIRDLEGSIEGACKGQAVLAASIDRLTGELDKLLEMTPMPLLPQPASRLSAIRKRILSLSDTLLMVQTRVVNMDRVISRERGSAGA